jgi:hypothetical protein
MYVWLYTCIYHIVCGMFEVDICKIFFCQWRTHRPATTCSSTINYGHVCCNTQWQREFRERQMIETLVYCSDRTAYIQLYTVILKGCPLVITFRRGVDHMHYIL